MKGQLRYVTHEELTTPKEGHVVKVDRWWAFLPGQGFIYFSPDGRHWTPQCNSNRAITEALIRQVYPGAEAVFVPVAYEPHNCSDYY